MLVESNKRPRHSVDKRGLCTFRVSAIEMKRHFVWRWLSVQFNA